MKKYFYTLLLFGLGYSVAFAGNPDRQGEAGAAELLLNPWARSAGLHSMSTASVSGVEAMRINIAGLSRISKGELVIGNTRLYEGSTLGINSVGFATKAGKNGAFGISLVAMDFGEINVTTTAQPSGTGGTYSPSFFNIGLGYAYTYENKISVGILVRTISETLPDVSASGIAIDAGVQYVSGDKDEFKLGIALRNIGSPMEFGGEGLSFRTDAPGSAPNYEITVNQRAEDFELPSLLNIGLSYDMYFGETNFLRGIVNFTSNAFSRDDIGVGAEFSFRDMVVLRGAYKLALDAGDGVEENLYTGLAGGVSIDVPLKRADNRTVGIDYAYRATNPFRGTHNFSIRLGF
ncbi:MAG: PorV/PorQ family protein [Saprospiraceae bacterium]|nr:PorV/PorQ family protein [Saprospiraceae bacterium]